MIENQDKIDTKTSLKSDKTAPRMKLRRVR